MEIQTALAQINPIILVKTTVITRKEYEWLLTFNDLEPHELAKVKEFEAMEQAKRGELPKREKPAQLATVEGLKPTKAVLYNAFIKEFRISQKKDFQSTPETIKNLEVLIKYFSKDPTFFECEHLVKKVAGKEVIPSFSKGLLIIGNYGNGKTTLMNCLEQAIKKLYELSVSENWDSKKQWEILRFKAKKSHDVVTEFESLSTPEHRDYFYKTYSAHRYYFDDVKKEKVASNFGKTELFQELLEKRYDKKATTYITCNYDPKFPNELERGLFEFGNRYGGHIFDRLLEMFNIIEFKGKSFRN
jgi:hypothetical protein